MKHVLKTMVVIFAFTFTAVLFAADEKKAYSESDYETVYQLLESMNMEKQFNEVVPAMVDMQIQAAPEQLAPLRQVLMDFFNKYVSYDALKKPVAEMYLDTFTVAELKELTEFYKTPLGKKIAEKSSELSLRAAQLGQDMVMANMGELQDAIMKAISTSKNADAEVEEVIIEEK